MKMAQKMMDGFIRDTICWQMNCLRSTFAGVYASRQLKAGDAAQPMGCSACFVPVMAIKKPVFLAGIENNRDFTFVISNFVSPNFRNVNSPFSG